MMIVAILIQFQLFKQNDNGAIQLTLLRGFLDRLAGGAYNPINNFIADWVPFFHQQVEGLKGEAGENPALSRNCNINPAGWLSQVARPECVSPHSRRKEVANIQP